MKNNCVKREELGVKSHAVGQTAFSLSRSEFQALAEGRAAWGHATV